MNAEFLSIVLICLRTFLITGVQIVLWCYVTEMLLKARHSMRVLISWMVLRMLFLTSIANVMLRHYYQNQPGWGIFNMLMILIALGGNFIALYYTFEGPFTKIIAGTYFSEIIMYMICYFILVWVWLICWKDVHSVIFRWNFVVLIY